MPDRYGVPEPPDPNAPIPHPQTWAIVDCGLCDDEGYRGTVVCDHIDRTEIVARGMTKVRTALKGKTS